MGTTFSLYSLAVLEAGVRTTEEPMEEAMRYGKETILLVDDEKFILEIGKDLLHQYGYKVLTAENGEDAVKIFKKEKDTVRHRHT